MSAQIALTISNAVLPITFLSGAEQYSRLFNFNAHALVDSQSDAMEFLDLPGCLTVDNQTAQSREIAGHIVNASSVGQHPDGRQIIAINLQPRWHYLQKQRVSRVFRDLTVIEIVSTVLQQHGYGMSDLFFHCEREYSLLTYCEQASGETDAEFVQRLLDKAGIYYWFDSHQQTEVIHFSDNNWALQASGLITPYAESSQLSQGHVDKENPFNVVGSDTAHIFDLETRNQRLPACSQVRDTDIDQPDHSIGSSNQILSNSDAQYPGVDLVGIAQGSQSVAEQLNEQLISHANTEHQQIYVSSHIPSLSPGTWLTADFNTLNATSLNGDYQVVRIVHHAKQPAGNEGQGLSLPYQNRIQLIKRQLHYCPELPTPLPQAGCSLASIESNSHYAELDELGRYRVKLHHDDNSYPTAAASPPIHQLQNYTATTDFHDGERAGWHTPLQHNAPVLISRVFGEIDRPIIIGGLPTSRHLSPSIKTQPQANRLRSLAGHQLEMSDTENNAQISLHTPAASNQLLLSNTDNEHQAALTSEQGNIHLSAKQNLQTHSEADTKEYIGTERRVTVARHSVLHTKTSTLHQQAETNINLQAQATTNLDSETDIEITSGQDLNIQAQAALQIQANDNLRLVTQNGDVHVQAKRDVIISGGGNGNIQLSHQSGAGIRIAPNGDITFYGQAIRSDMSQSIDIKGSIQRVSGQTAPKNKTIPDVPTPKEIQQLTAAPDEATCLYPTVEFNLAELGTQELALSRAIEDLHNTVSHVKISFAGSITMQKQGTCSTLTISEKNYKLKAKQQLSNDLHTITSLNYNRMRANKIGLASSVLGEFWTTSMTPEPPNKVKFTGSPKTVSYDSAGWQCNGNIQLIIEVEYNPSGPNNTEAAYWSNFVSWCDQHPKLVQSGKIAGGAIAALFAAEALLPAVIARITWLAAGFAFASTATAGEDDAHKNN